MTATRWKVLIAHAPGEEDWAERIAGPIRELGYEVAHEGTVMVGDSIVEEASKILSLGGPLVLCATVKAVGTKWARRLIAAARRHSGVKIFAVHLEEEADIQSLVSDEKISSYWQDPHRAMEELLAALVRSYPVEASRGPVDTGYLAEIRYRELMLKAWDIIDLGSLPENEQYSAQALELRRLYVPLRVRAETSNADIEIEDPLRAPIGEWLGKVRRLVVLGEPGSGKSTLIRWIATAYLLFSLKDRDSLPDKGTLPHKRWLPIVVSCRDLDAQSLGGPLAVILDDTLRKAELDESEVEVLRGLLLARLREGKSILLIDDLDAIPSFEGRIRFCKQIEQISIAYPEASIVVASRTVGYREMHYRLGRGFEHVLITDLSGEDKDEFALRWCELMEPQPARRLEYLKKIKSSLHSTDRIERLTGSPMLLTTLALVVNKLGELPRHRADLYWQAVQVLLNWRPESGELIDPEEALPQLEYIAYFMCDRGVQRLREDEILDLLERVRSELQEISALRAHTPRNFLRLLEKRTGIVRKANEVSWLGKMVPVYEFRHLTFQEYLAARALVDGFFPGRSPGRTLADHVAPLAGRVVSMQDGEAIVSEYWHETLRLCATCVEEDHLEALLLSILNPLPGEEASITARPRAILASLCLVDEPSVDEGTAWRILRGLTRQIRNQDQGLPWKTNLDHAIREIVETRWFVVLKLALIEEFQERAADSRWNIGLIFIKLDSIFSLKPDEAEDPLRFEEEETPDFPEEETWAIARALGIAGSSLGGGASRLAPEVPRLLRMLGGSAAASHAAAWALYSIHSRGPRVWRPGPAEMKEMVEALSLPHLDPGAAWCLIKVLAREKVASAAPVLNELCEDPNPGVRKAAREALQELTRAGHWGMSS